MIHLFPMSDAWKLSDEKHWKNKPTIGFEIDENLDRDDSTDHHRIYYYTICKYSMVLWKFIGDGPHKMVIDAKDLGLLQTCEPGYSSHIKFRIRQPSTSFIEKDQPDLLLEFIFKYDGKTIWFYRENDTEPTFHIHENYIHEFRHAQENIGEYSHAM